MRRLFTVLGLVALLALGTTGIVLAAEPQTFLGGKVMTGDTVTIPSGTTVDHDLYVFAGNVVIDGTVTGDVVAAAGNITVNGSVGGDVFAAGGQVTINGPVTGDVRAASGQVSVNGDVTEDVLAAAGQVSIDGKVGQDLIVWSGQLSLVGSVAGGTAGQVGAYTKAGTVGGTDGIVVTPRGAFSAGPYAANPFQTRDPVLDAIRHFITVLVFALLAIWLWPRVFAAAEQRARLEPVSSFVWGIASFVGYIVAIVAIVLVGILLAILFAIFGLGGLLAVDVFGVILGIIGLTVGFLIAAAFLSDAIVGLALAHVVGARTGWSGRYAATSAGQGRWADFWLLAAGAAVVVIVTAIPVVGGLVKLVVILVGVGAIWLAWRATRTTPASMATPIPPPPAPPAEPPPAATEPPATPAT